MLEPENHPKRAEALGLDDCVSTDHWQQLKWGDLVTLEYGKGLRSYQNTDEGYPVFGTNGQIGWHNDYLCPHDGVIIGRKGAYRGVHYSDKPFYVIDTAFYMRPKVPNLDLKWAYYQLSHFDINNLDSGSAIPSTSREAFYQIPVKLPPLPTQRKIASVLSAYDDLIENNTRRIAILEEMAQRLYREWFIDFRFPGHEGVQMVESELGPIPEGWEETTLSDLTEFSRSGVNPSNYPNETFAHFSIPAYDEGRMPRLERGASILSNKSVVPHVCVLLSKINPRIPRVWLPFVDGEHRPITSTEFLVLQPKPPATNVYLYETCRSAKFLGEFASRALGTSTSHQRVQPASLLSMPLILPPEELIETYTVQATPMEDHIQKLREKNTNLRRTRDLLLPKLVSPVSSTQ